MPTFKKESLIIVTFSLIVLFNIVVYPLRCTTIFDNILLLEVWKLLLSEEIKMTKKEDESATPRD